MAHDANEVRRMAEAADGTREQDVYFTVVGDELSRTPTKPPAGKGITVKTTWHGPGLRGAASLSVSKGEIPPGADAAFTTQSAFEKFVLAYYIRSKTLDELRTMMDRAYTQGVTAAFHDPSSETDTTSGFGIVRADGTVEFI